MQEQRTKDVLILLLLSLLMLMLQSCYTAKYQYSYEKPLTNPQLTIGTIFRLSSGTGGGSGLPSQYFQYTVNGKEYFVLEAEEGDWFNVIGEKFMIEYDSLKPEREGEDIEG